MQRPDPQSIPLSSGVYMYKDARGRILYVGKARILRRRVLSYFRPTGIAPKTAAMLKRARALEYFTTTTEKEALLLEASLIKKYRPPYNIVLRDDKNYALFKLNLKQPFPRLEIVRQVKRDGARYFGPFTSALAARETWKLLHRAFALRRCSDRAMKNRVRPCLYYHMGQCPGPCMGLADENEYNKTARKVCEVLSGNADALIAEMRGEMLKAADTENYERAAEIRDQINAVVRTVEKQAAILPGSRDMDAIGIHQADNGLALGIVFVRNGAVGDNRSFFWPGLAYEDSSELLLTFLNQFYMQASPPPRILLPWFPTARRGESQEAAADNVEHDASSAENGSSDELAHEDFETEDFMENKAALEQIFSERRGGQVKIVAPRNASDNQLIDLARANAKEEARRRHNQGSDLILEKIKTALHLPAMPRRIECVDVSHISGKQTRVGMVVYENGAPDKAAYRIYGMPDSNDDYGTLYAWVERRLESGPPWPELLLIDGGRGQLASVVKALENAGQKDLFPLAAIAKARDEEGRADRRVGNVADRIFLPGRSNPVPLREGCQELLFLQQIRDAAHVFSVYGHHRARKAAAFSGELMRLPGIGPATARLLWDKFGSIDAMRKAEEKDLMEIAGIGKNRAKMLVEKLRALA